MSLEKPTCFTRLMVRLGGLIGSRYHTTNFGTIIRHWRLLLAALSRAFWIAGSGVNPPHVIHSWVKKTAGSPDPHPMSRTDPVISPLRTSSVNSFQGRPISQGGATVCRVKEIHTSPKLVPGLSLFLHDTRAPPSGRTSALFRERP